MERDRRKRPKKAQAPHPFPLPSQRVAISWFLLLAFFISGATSLALEVAWSKVLSYLLGVDPSGYVPPSAEVLPKFPKSCRP